jgi:parallel beta-helix repeat protein
MKLKIFYAKSRTISLFIGLVIATLLLTNSVSAATADLKFVFGQSGDTPVVGDWNGDGKDTIGVYHSGVFNFRNSNTAGNSDISFAYGKSGDIPVVGDWNGDGKVTPGVYRSGVFYLRNSNTAGKSDMSFAYGQSGDIPVIGDWNDDGTDTVGVYRNGVFYLRNSNTAGKSDITFANGKSGDIPVIGDWNSDGKDTTGVYRNGVFYLRNSNSAGAADLTVAYGQPGDKPVAGDFTGNGKNILGVVRGNTWYQDLNGDGSSNGLSPVVTPSVPTITVTVPNGGESWARGTSHTITWTSSGLVGSSVKIELLKANSVVQTLSSSTPNDGSFASWNISTGLVTGTDYRIRVTSSSNAAITDTSGSNFAINSIISISSVTPVPSSGTPAQTNGVVSSSTLYLTNFGIKADGSDETAKLQSALTYAKSNGYTAVSFPTGGKTIGISDPIYIPANMEIIGNECTIKLLAMSGIGHWVWTIDTGPGVYIHNLKINGNKDNQQASSDPGYYFPKAPNDGIALRDGARFENNEVYNFGGYMVESVKGDNVVIKNNILHDGWQYAICTAGLDSDYSNNLVVSNNKIYRMGQVGIKIQHTSNSRFEGNTITMPARYDLFSVPSIGSPEPTGIRLYSYDGPNNHLTITGNTIIGTGGNNEIAIESDTSANNYITITNNQIRNAYKGINIQFNNGIITENTIDYVSTCIANGGSGNTISGNSCST